MENVFVARQPIFKKGMKLHGYELRFTHCSKSSVGLIDPDQAASEVILNTLNTFPLEDLVGPQPAFINLTRYFLLQQYPLPFPKQGAVVQILDDMTIDPPLIEAVRKLKQSGYTVAVDGDLDDEAAAPLMPMVDIVKLRMNGPPSPLTRERIHKLQSEGTQVLADQITTAEELAHCVTLGCDFFQGNNLSIPSTGGKEKLAAEKTTLLELMAELHAPEPDILDLEKIIRRDVSLSYQLLRYINSAYFRRSFEIRSLRQAVMMLGLRELKRWVSVLSLHQAPGKSDEMIKQLLVRGRMAELLADRIAPDYRESCFMTGLFSGLDVLLDAPMSQVVEELPLAPDIRRALLQHEGIVGQIVQAVLAYELADSEKIKASPLPPGEFRDHYLNALQWQLAQPLII